MSDTHAIEDFQQSVERAKTAFAAWGNRPDVQAMIRFATALYDASEPDDHTSRYRATQAKMRRQHTRRIKQMLYKDYANKQITNGS